MAADWFISPSGSDSNAGTSSGAPFLTHKKAQSVVSAGEEIECATGSYNEQIVRGDFVATGTDWGNKILISAAAGATPIFLPTTADTSDEVLRMSNASGVVAAYIEFKGITFDGTNCQKGCVKITVDAGGAVAHHIRFDDCTFQNGAISTTPPEASSAAGHGILYSGRTHGNEVLNCTIKTNGIQSGLDHGIYYSACSDSFVEDTTFDNNYAHPIQLFGSNVTNNHIRRCLFKNCNSNAIVMGGAGTGAHNLAYNNVIKNDGDPASPSSFGIEIHREDGSVVYNNSIHGFSRSIKVQSTSTNALIKNNACYGNTNNAVLDEGTGTTELTNLDDGTNPLWTNVGSYDFSIPTGSPCKDAGTNLSGTFTDDYIGTIRPQASAWDIGSHEFIVAAAGGGGSGGGMIFKWLPRGPVSRRGVRERLQSTWGGDYLRILKS